MGHIGFATLITVIGCIALLLFNYLPFLEKNKCEKILKIVVPEDLDYTNMFDEVFDKYVKKYEVIVIENGNFNFDTSDDTVHSNNYVGIKDGVFKISLGDDAIHADTKIIIDNGQIDISKNYEGIESAKITINNGKINIISSDDGINIAGGNDSSAMGGRPGQNRYNESNDNILTINNGDIYINASGDGIDINGSGYINDGNIIVDGPVNDGNGYFDYDKKFVITNGTLYASGSSGMAQSLTAKENVKVIIIRFNSYLESNSKISIIDSSKNEIVNYTPSKKFSSIFISSPEFEKGETYTILVNNEEYETFTVDSDTTSIGTMGMNQMPHGGRR